MPIPSKIIMYPDNDNRIRADELKDEELNAFFDNTATVTATLYDWQGNQIVGCINVSLTYLNGTNGSFRGLVDDVFAPAVGDGYKLVVTALQGAAKGKWGIPVEVVERAKV